MPGNVESVPSKSSAGCCVMYLANFRSVERRLTTLILKADRSMFQRFSSVLLVKARSTRYCPIIILPWGSTRCSLEVLAELRYCLQQS